MGCGLSDGYNVDDELFLQKREQEINEIQFLLDDEQCGIDKKHAEFMYEEFYKLNHTNTFKTFCELFAIEPNKFHQRVYHTMFRYGQTHFGEFVLGMYNALARDYEASLDYSFEVYNYEDNQEGKGISADDVIAICEEVHQLPEIGRFHKHPKQPHDTVSNKKLKNHFNALIGKKKDRMMHKEQILQFVHESPEYSAFDFIQHVEESCGGIKYWKSLFDKRRKQTKFCGKKINQNQMFDIHELIKRLDNESKEVLHGPKEAITRGSMKKARKVSALGFNKRAHRVKKIGVGGKHADINQSGV
jgi:hypothetical protein